MSAATCITAATHLPTRHGRFLLETFRYGDDPLPHMALSVGLAGNTEPLVRVHSECLTGEVFGSLKCDCAEQLDAALAAVQAAGSGVIVYLRQEGRGIGLENKVKAYALQEHGLDTVEANVALDLPVDARSYAAATAYLAHKGINRCRLLTNNPDKLHALTRAGIEVTRTPLRAGHRHAGNRAYLAAKRLRLGQDC